MFTFVGRPCGLHTINPSKVFLFEIEIVVYGQIITTLICYKTNMNCTETIIGGLDFFNFKIGRLQKIQNREDVPEA